MSALRIKPGIIGPYALPILVALATVVSTGDALAGANTVLPFSDNFEAYTNLTRLNTGTNGWYGDSSNIIVQTTTVRSGTNAAMIPVDCTLSNRFQDLASTNVWIQMDVRPKPYDGTNTPVVNTNSAAMLYINSNGYFVVHNGPATNPSPTNSVGWVTNTTVQISTNGTTWVRINVYENYERTNWDLYADGVLVTNNVGFINTNLTNFAGFDVYNGSSTSYLDNVSVIAGVTNEGQYPLIVVPAALATNVFAGPTPGAQTVKVINVWSAPVGFEVTTNQSWISLSVWPTNGSVSAGTTQEVAVTNNSSTAGWLPGVSNTTLTIVSTNGSGGSWATQTVEVLVNVMKLQAAPANLTNVAWVGQAPTSQTFVVSNTGGGSFNYTVAITTGVWLSCSPTSGVLDAGGSSTLTLTYSNTAGWPAGTSQTVVRIVSADSIGATQTVAVTLNVQNIAAGFVVTPTSLTNTVWIGETPPSQTFDVRNTGAASLAWTVGITNLNWVSCSSTSGNLSAGGSSTLTLTYSNTAGWVAGQSNTTLIVATTNGVGTNRTVDVKLTVASFDSGVLQVAPSTLANTVGKGATPASQTFSVINTGAASLAYTVAVTTGAWLTCSSSSGSLAPTSSNTLTLSYVGTESWPAGDISNTTVRVTSVNGYGATGTVWVTLTILGSGITNIIPYADNFEAYAAQMALVGGVSGWYGSASSVLVQDEIKASGTKAAMIPTDCMLSNRFVAGTPFNVRIAIDLRPACADFAETNFPAVDTNAVALFYVDTNGHFVVRNGTSTWSMVSNAVGTPGVEFKVTNDTWTPIVIYLDYRYRHWKLKARDIIITNKIGFVTQQTNGFSGFEIYSGASTSYLDNVSVNWWDRFKVNDVLDHKIRFVNGVLPDRILGVLTNVP